MYRVLYSRPFDDKSKVLLANTEYKEGTSYAFIIGGLWTDPDGAFEYATVLDYNTPLEEFRYSKEKKGYRPIEPIEFMC